MPLEILTEEDKRNILQALKDLQDVKAEIERAKRAGLDVAELEARALELEQRLQGIKKVYIDATQTVMRRTR